MVEALHSITTPRNETASYSMLLISLKQQTEVLLISLKDITTIQAANPQTAADLIKASKQPIQTCQALHTLSEITKIVKKLTFKELNALFESYDLCNTLFSCTSQVYSQLLLIKPATTLLKILKTSPQESVKIVKPILFTINYSLDFLKQCAFLLDYIFVDSYQVAPIIKQFSQQKQFLKIMVSLVSKAQQIDLLAESIRKTSSRSSVPTLYARVLFKLITFQSPVIKQQFIESDGIKILKGFLTTAHEAGLHEMYLYFLGMIAPLLKLSTSVEEDFQDAGFVPLLVRHTLTSEQHELLTPLFLALKSLNQAAELSTNFQLLSFLVKKMSGCYGNQSQKHVFTAGSLLMASINNFEQSFADEVYSMQTELKKCGESKKVLMTNKLNRLHEWYQNFKDITGIYEQYKNSIETIQQNAFDDDLIEQALNTLKKIWAKHGLARSFVQLDYGSVGLVLNLTNSESNRVVLRAVEAILGLLKGEECCDITIKLGAVSILKQSLMSKSLDIRKTSLQIINKLLASKSEGVRFIVQSDLFENSVLEFCVKQLDQQEEEGEEEIFEEALEIISSSVVTNDLNAQFFMSRDALTKIMLRLRGQIEVVSKRSDLKGAEKMKNVKTLHLLLTATANLVEISGQVGQDKMRELSLFGNLVTFLNQSLATLMIKPEHQEIVISQVFKLLCTAIDENKPSQEALFKLRSVQDMVLQFLKQRKSFKLSGCACLLAQNLMWKNQVIQTKFLTKDFIAEVIKLIDLHQVMNEADPDVAEESMQEVTFYALLALINLTQDSPKGQQMAKEGQAITTLLNQLKSGTYDPKKTACFCFTNIVQGNGPNQAIAIQKGAVRTFVDLISDEDDDELSTKAFEALEAMGPQVIPELIKTVDRVLAKVEREWHQGNTVIFEIQNKKERHLIAKSQSQIPNLRQVGPQDQDDLLDQTELEQLQKVLPVLNGLLFNQKSGIQTFKSLMQLFDKNLPLDCYEAGLQALQNLLIQKSLNVEGVNFLPLRKFLYDIARLEFEVVSKPVFYMVETYIKMNPEFIGDAIGGEKTIEQMQQYVYAQDLLTLKDGKLFLNEKAVGSVQRESIIKRLQEIRGLVYACLSRVLLDNEEIVDSLIREQFSALPALLLRDVKIMPELLFSATSDEDQGCSENLNKEALELTMQLMTDGLIDLFNVDLKFMNDLKHVVQECDLGHDNKRIIAQIDEVIAEWK